jgi:hypothetical protein
MSYEYIYYVILRKGDIKSPAAKNFKIIRWFRMTFRMEE